MADVAVKIMLLSLNKVILSFGFGVDSKEPLWVKPVGKWAS